MAGIVVLVSYTALPQQVATAREAIAALVAAVLASEPECAGINLLQSVADPARITLVERWPSQEVFLGPHMQQPHIQAFIQRAGTFLAGPPDISFWQDAGAH